MIEQTEIIYRWHRRESKASIARSLGIGRKTVRKYVNKAIEAGLSLEMRLPADHEIAKLLNLLEKNQVIGVSSTPVKNRLLPYDAQIAQWAKDPAINQSQMWRLFKEQHPKIQVSRSTFREYVQQHHRPPITQSTVRLMIPPGQAQVDFGYVGRMFDPVKRKLRKTWAFIMTLSYSRHRFVRFVFRQDVATWVDCHIRAFAFFGGVPQSILLDNLKAGVIKPDIYDPILNHHYQECERYYGFVADPAKVASPKMKGRVERCVPVIRGHLLAGRHFDSIDQANERALKWCTEEIGSQVHGSTKQKPMELFEKVEKSKLLPLPSERFEIVSWQRAKVFHDQHVIFDGAYYSVPTRFLGKQVDIRGSDRFIQIFYEGELIKTHLPTERGTSRTDPNDYPQRQRIYLLQTAEVCREKALKIGEATGAVMGMLLKCETNRNLRKAHKLLRLSEQYGIERLDAVCQQALEYQTLEMKFFEGTLKQPLRVPALEEHRQPAPGYLRPANYFAQCRREKSCNIN